MRGQTGWLIPQPEVNYAMTYRNVQILSKSDGIMVIALEDGDMKGYNNSDKSVRRAKCKTGRARDRRAVSRFPTNPA